jgi:hypothetical protein
MELVLEVLLILGRISRFPGNLITVPSIGFRTKEFLESKEELNRAFSDLTLLIFELNSVSYEEIVFVSMNVLELIVPVVDGKIVEEEVGSFGSSVALF